MAAAFDYVAAFADQTWALTSLLFVLAFANVFVPPVPIETIALFVGYLSGIGHGHPLLMWLALAGGMAAGSTVLYYLARRQGTRLLRLRIVQKQVTPERLAVVERWFQRFGVWTIYGGKIIPGMSFATVLASGLFGLGQRRALTAIYLANMIYFAAAVALGRLLGERWQDVDDLLSRLALWLVAACVAAALAYVLYRYALRARRPV